MPDATRVAIVTGAARGIGAATAVRLARDGHDVAILDLNADDCADTLDRVTAAGARGLVVPADVSDEAAVARAVDAVATELGPPTILVNNAGILRDELLFRMSLTDWDAVIAVHLRGAFLMARATQSHMTQAAFGRIVNMSSTSALGNRGQSNYSAAKAGLVGFTKTLALELGRYGITANAIAPGYIHTDMATATAERVGLTTPDLLARWADRTALRRVGQPEEVAHAVSFFVSEGAGFITGQVLFAAGGPSQ